MIKKLKRLLQKATGSEFIRNTATLATGTTAAQAISIFTAPILYRIYDPEDYGTLGLYMAITGVVGVFSTLQYTQAILLEKEDEEALQAFWLVRLLNLGITLLFLIIVLFANNKIAYVLNNPQVANWLYLIPISIFFTGQNEFFSIWANRKKMYDVLMYNSMLSAVLVPIFSISLGLMYDSVLGLFIGLLISQMAPALYMGWKVSRVHSFSLSTLQISKVKEVAIKYKSFPRYSLPSEFINRFINQLPVFMLSTYAGSGVVGVYNLSVRMLGLPISLVGGAISSVFRQKATEDYNSTGSCRKVFISTLKVLSGVSIIPLLIILFFGPMLFAFVFGEEWREAGVFSQILIFLYVGKLVVSPLTYVIYIRDKTRENLVYHIYILVSSALIFILSFEVLNVSITATLLLFSLNYLLFYAFYLFSSYKLTNGSIN